VLDLLLYAGFGAGVPQSRYLGCPKFAWPNGSESFLSKVVASLKIQQREKGATPTALLIIRTIVERVES
jgi:hypothetical protein